MNRYRDQIYQAILNRDPERVAKLIRQGQGQADLFLYLWDAWTMMALRLRDGPLAEGLAFPFALRWEHRKDYATAMARHVYLCPGGIYKYPSLTIMLPPIVPGRQLAEVPQQAFIEAQHMLADPRLLYPADKFERGFRRCHLMMCIAGRLLGWPRPVGAALATGQTSAVMTAYNMLHKEEPGAWDFGSFSLPERTGEMVELLVELGILAAAVRLPPEERAQREVQLVETLVADFAPHAEQFLAVHRGQFRTFAELCEIFLRPDIYRPLAITLYVTLVALDETFGLGTYYDHGVMATLRQGPPSGARFWPAPSLLPHEEAEDTSETRPPAPSAIPNSERAIITLNDDAKKWCNLGVDYAGRGQHQRAIECYNKALEFEPDSPVNYNNRGNSYCALLDDQRAIEDYSLAIRLKPDYWEALNNRGAAYIRLEQYQVAVRDLDKAIKLKPDLAQAYFSRSMARICLRDLVGGRTDLAEARRLATSNPHLLTRIVEFEAETGLNKARKNWWEFWK